MLETNKLFNNGGLVKPFTQWHIMQYASYLMWKIRLQKCWTGVGTGENLFVVISVLITTV